MSRDSLNYIKEKFKRSTSQIPTKYSGYIDASKMIVDITRGTRLPTRESRIWKRKEFFSFLNSRNKRQLEFLKILSRRKDKIYHKEVIMRMKKKLGNEFGGDIRGTLGGLNNALNRSKKETIYISKWDETGHYYKLKNEYYEILREYFSSAKPKTIVKKQIKLKKWSYREISKYLDRLKNDHPDSYMYFKLLTEKDKITPRKKLIELLSKKLKKPKFSGYSLAGIQMGITSSSDKVGYERLDYKSEDRESFSINKKYRSLLRKYFAL